MSTYHTCTDALFPTLVFADCPHKIWGGGRTSWDLNLTNLSSYKIVLLGSSLCTKNRADTAVFSRLLARWAGGCSRDAETKAAGSSSEL